MAKANNQSSGERSRVRVIVLDLDVASGDLNQLAGAILNAVNPPVPAVTTLQPALPPTLPLRQNGDQPGLLEEQIEAPSQQEWHHQVRDAPLDAAKPSNGVRKKKRLRTPQPVDLDLVTGDKPFKDYYDEVAPKNDSKRYLVISQWLKVYRGINEIGADHVYTCYRTLGMQVPEDVLSVFRGLKKQGWVESGSSPGLFKINHIGENYLMKKE